MKTGNKNRSFFRTSRFQRPVLNLFILSALSTIGVAALCASYLYYDMTQTLVGSGREVPAIKMMILFILMIIPLIFLVMVIWAFRLSNQLLGAFERLLRELDGIIEGKSKKHVQARKGDHLAEELFAKINALIDRLP